MILYTALYRICASANFSWLTFSARIKENYRTGQGSLFVGVTKNKVQYLHGGGPGLGLLDEEGILDLAMDARFEIVIAHELPAAQFWRYGGYG